MEIQWGQFGDLVETNWKPKWRQTMETNMETPMETKEDYMDTKGAFLRGKVKISWCQHGDKNGVNMETT